MSGLMLRTRLLGFCNAVVALQVQHAQIRAVAQDQRMIAVVHVLRSCGKMFSNLKR